MSRERMILPEPIVDNKSGPKGPDVAASFGEILTLTYGLSTSDQVAKYIRESLLKEESHIAVLILTDIKRRAEVGFQEYKFGRIASMSDCEA